MKNKKITELALLLRYQQSLLNLAARCSQPEAARKRPAAVPSRALEQLVRKVEAQAS
jgi:hypothetical protein